MAQPQSQPQPGDLVRLKSGGPIMTFSGFHGGSASVAVCSYFVGPEYHSHSVGLVALVKVTEEELKQEEASRPRQS
jgi:uncharacterized protein YodC (DUF2158 family)